MMKRNYNNGIKEKVTFFTGVEVEKTPAFGMKTLFVTGTHPCDVIQKHYDDEQCEHIFFGANHSFEPVKNSEWESWERMIKAFLTAGKLCSLDIPLSHAEALLESCMIEQNNFIPQIRIPLPYIKQYNYNTMIKLDDKDFNATNPGVWCHRLHNLMDDEKFTDWTKYGLDKIIK